MSYHFNEIEAKWQKYWAENQTFRAANPGEEGSNKPKFYVLDMFPYPSGAGLHVGHPLGYIASDIYARYKRHKGFNVMHPQGYDSFGLPAEQYAIQTGQHPAVTTAENIQTYRRQLDQLGFSFDWSREVRTSDPKYYKWTQWIFIQLFNSWYNKDSDKAEDISTLINIFEKEGNATVNAASDEAIEQFSAEQWQEFSSEEKQKTLLQYRLTYLSDTEVNWCPALGTVLANDEVVNGVSERGGHPVIRKKMKQWSMRISAYAQRLLNGLDKIDWPQPLKDSQTNWIGRSEGAMVNFKVLPTSDLPLTPSGGGGTEPRYRTSNSEIYGVLLDRAKKMRKSPTPAEAKLWKSLRNKGLDVKFRRQHPIFNYIVDFVCIEKRLIIEVDGEIHNYQLTEDAERQLLLEQKKGFKVLRFTNKEVLNDIDNVLLKIIEELNSPSFGGGRGEVLEQLKIPVFTTRPDTIFGVSFMTLAPEHDLVPQITTPEQKEEVEAYIKATAKRSELDRMADVKTITGAFTGAYAEHPFTKEPIPIWIGDYVLAGYGTGAVMSVPCGDQRDYDFAKHFNISIPNIFEGVDISKEAFSDKESTVIANSDFLNGLSYKKAMKTIIYEIEKRGFGYKKINYRMRDAVFSRQRYWGEPFPVYYVNGLPQMIDEKHLPLKLPEVEKYLPTEDGKPPLGNADVWAWDTKNNKVVSNDKLVIPTERGTSDEESQNDSGIYPLELNTMPGWAGSSQYFNRYMDPHNENEIFSQEAIKYWQDVDLYIGGSEHATGHLLYSRFWQKFMFDKDLVPQDEFAKKLINQGMILGTSAIIHRLHYSGTNNNGLLQVEVGSDIYVSFSLIESLKSGSDYKIMYRKDSDDKFFELEKILKQDPKIPELEIIAIQIAPLRVDVNLLVNSREIDIDKLKAWQPQFMDGIFITDDGKFTVTREVEKMSKSKYNVVNPDAICEQYGADSLRMYEMFLGPLEQAKPWNTAGITGVHGFLKKLWKLYHSGNQGNFKVIDSPLEGGSGGVEPSPESYKTLHKTIKKVEEDIENFSFNTSVSTFMIAVNELTSLKCANKEILEPLLILISPYAPHIAEELWSKLGHNESISTAPFPKFDASHLVESSKTYPISFNGKMRFTMDLSLDLTKEEIEKAVMEHEKTQAQLAGRTPKKVIVVPGKIVNIVG